MKSTRTINKIFQETDSDLAILVTRTRLLKRLTHILRRQLEKELATHCYVGNLDKDTLVILADSAARASKLRFCSSQLLDVLPTADPAFLGIKQIRIKLLQQSAQNTDDSPSNGQGPHMNQENANGIKTLANSVDDEQLHDALLRLARHAKEK